MKCDLLLWLMTYEKMVFTLQKSRLSFLQKVFFTNPRLKAHPLHVLVKTK